jgi:small-conductance mechanosensitive channel
MEIVLESLKHWAVVIYLGLIVLALVAPPIWRGIARHDLNRRREDIGLDSQPIIGPGRRLAAEKKASALDAVIFVAVLVIAPYFLAKLYETNVEEDDPGQGLLFTFIGLLLWVLISGTGVASAFLGGLAFRTLCGFAPPFQVGDRVTLGDYAGRVESIGLFYVRLVTADDDLISVPTAGLLTQPLISANAGDRASLCVMQFYLPASVDAKQLGDAEDTIWDAVQASTYFDPEKPLQIYIKQLESSIEFTAKAYVANTYQEPNFKTEVTKRVLLEFRKNEIPLSKERDKMSIQVETD